MIIAPNYHHLLIEGKDYLLMIKIIHTLNSSLNTLYKTLILWVFLFCFNKCFINKN